MRNLKIMAISCCLVLLHSCAYDSEDDLIAIEENEEEVDTENPNESGITYANTIKAIMDSNCVSCHSSPPRNGAPFALVNFSQVSGRANGILNAMARESGSPGAMPPAGRLPQNTINQIQEWIDNDTPEN